MSNLIYFDNAATSWPKPPEVADAISHFLENIGANPGRSAHHRSIEAARVVFDARQAVAQLFNFDDPTRVVFGSNATEALNLALLGVLHPGDHVITSSMEHNSVMRPLRYLEQQGVEVTIVPCSGEGELDPCDVSAVIRPDTAMIIMNHASNVIGTILPIEDIASIACDREILFMVDAAQTAGAFPIDLSLIDIDLLAFSGHKSLLGPMGTGALIIGERVNHLNLAPLKRGGTGSRSEYEEQPSFLPDMCESGTPNAMGLAGLAAGVHWVLDQGITTIRQHEMELTQVLIEGLSDAPGITIYGRKDACSRTATVSFNLHHISPSELGLRLDEEFGILCRVGLHCAPSAHRTIGTFPGGTVRFSLGNFNTVEEIALAVEAVTEIAKDVS